MEIACSFKSKVYKLIIFAFMPFIFPFFVLFSEEAKGDEFKLIPSLSIKEEYNDNLFFTEKDKKDDFITTITPGIELIDRTERLDLNLSARLGGLIYAKNEDLNFLNQIYSGRLRYLLHQKLKFSADGGFTKDFSPDRDIEVTGLVTKAIRRYKYNFGSGLEYTLTEKTKTEFSYSFERYDYERDPEFVDTISHGVNFGLIHDLSQQISNTLGRANLGYYRYKFQDTDIDYYYGTIGMSRAISEKWNILIDGGASYTHSEFDVERLELTPFLRIVREREKEKGVGWVAQATLSYRGEKTTKGEKTTGDLTFNHRMMPASGIVGVSERTSITLDIAHRFTYEFLGRLSVGYYLNRAERGKFSRASIDEATFRINPRVRYEFTKDIALEASYSFTLVKDKEADTDARRNLFMIYFIIQYPLFE